MIVQNNQKLGTVYSTVRRFVVYNSTHQDCSVRLLLRRSNKSEEEDLLEEINNTGNKDKLNPTNEYIPISSFTFGLSSFRQLNVWSCQKFKYDEPWTCDNLKIDMNVEFTGDLRYNNSDRDVYHSSNKTNQKSILKKDA